MRSPKRHIILLFTLLLASCSAPRESSLDTSRATLLHGAPDTKGSFERAREAGDRAWEARHERARLEEAIAHYEAASEATPAGSDERATLDALHALYIRLARAHHLLASGHMGQGEDDPERLRVLRQARREHYEKGLTAAERALALADGDFARQLSGKEKTFLEHISSAPDEALPALYWYAMNLSAWSRLKGMRHTMLQRERVLRAMEVVRERAPGYDHAGADRFLGIYHTRFPGSGGDPPKSEEAFERSLERAPNCFETRYQYALRYAVLLQKRALFERQLEIILSTPPDIVSEIAPENLLAQVHARTLLSRADELFY